MAAITLAQSNQSSGSSTTRVLAYSSNVTAGNCLIAVAASGDLATPTISDSLNGSWTGPVVQSQNTIHDSIWAFPNTLGGACTVTLTFPASSTIALTIMEFTGLALAGVADKTATAHSPPNGSSNSVGPTGVTTQPIELVVMATSALTGSTFVVGAGYTLVSNNSAQGVQYLVTSSTGTQSGSISWTGSHSWDSVIATFIPQAAQPLPIYTRRYVHYYI